MKTNVKATWYIASICAYVLGLSLPCYAATDSTKTNFPATPSQQYVAGTVIPIAVKNNDFSTLKKECPAQTDLHCPDINNTFPLSDSENAYMRKFGSHSLGWTPYNSDNNCPAVCYVRRLLQITTANGNPTTYPIAPNPAGPNNPITNITVIHPAVCPAGYVAEAMYNPDWDIETVPLDTAMPYPIPDFQTLDNYVMSGYSCGLVASTAPFQATACFQNDANTQFANYTYYPAFVGRAIALSGNCPSSPSTLNDYYNYAYCNYNNSDSVAYYNNPDTEVLNLALYQSNTIYQVFANNGVGMFTDIGAQYYTAGYDATRGGCFNSAGGNRGATGVANLGNPCYLTYSKNYEAVGEFANFSVNVTCKNWSTPFAAIAKPIFSYYQCTKPAGTQFADYKVPTYVACARVTPLWHVKGQPYFEKKPSTPLIEPLSP